MGCIMCQKPIKKGVICSGSCRYKKNVLIWVLKFMKSNETLDWGEIQSWVEGPKETKKAEKKKETAPSVDPLIGQGWRSRIDPNLGKRPH